MPDSRLLFEHQDGTLAFSIKRASYHLSDRGTFSCSIECELNAELEYMSEPFFAAHNVKSGSSIRVGQVLQIAAKYEQGQSVQLPRVHLYAGTHRNPWNTRLEVISIGSGTVGISGSFMTTDPNYYDARAKDARASFFAVFVRSRSSELWSPY
jgi:hypothetical protein